MKTHQNCILGPDGFDSWGDGPRSHKLSPSGAPRSLLWEPLRPARFTLAFLGCGYSGSSLVAGAQELFQG